MACALCAVGYIPSIPAENDGLSILYVDENGEIQSENYDMVVLSVGLEVDPDTSQSGQKARVWT